MSRRTLSRTGEHPTSASQEPRLRVLLVEDDEDDYVLTRDLLSDIPGYRFDLEWAATYEAGQEALRQDRHEVYLFDYRLGEHNGLELLREAVSAGVKAPVIFLTGQGERELDIEAMKAGASDYLIKGKIDAAILERSIRYALQQKQHADELEERVAERTADLKQSNAALVASEERYRLVVEGAMGFAIMMLDTEGRVTTWNVGAQRLFGYTEAEVMGGHFARFFTAEDVASGKPERELGQARNNERENDDNWLVRKDGSWFWASGTTTGLRDETGNLRGYAKIVHDLSERKRAEEALRDADRRKDEFLAMLAHELRNPLAPIRNALHIIGMRGPERRQSVRQAWEIVDRQVEHMVRLVDDLLDVSRITRGKINLQKQPLDVSSIVSRAVEGSRPLIDSRRHTLEIHLPDDAGRVEGDPVRLAQVLWNLLNNAAKYTPEGGHIRLTVEKGEGEVVLRVRDTGMGIPADVLPAIFDLFTQAERTLERAEGGLGIGLTLVRQLTEMHDGTVEATSAGPGQGSEFVVRLPLLMDAPLADGAAGAAADDSGSSRRRRILVVDDNRDSAESLATLLRLVGNEVKTAHDGRQALETAAEYRPDMVLLDIGLPVLNGYEVARRLRTEPSYGRAVLVALTGYGSEEDRRRSLSAGFDHHMVKPVDFDSLRTLLALPES